MIEQFGERLKSLRSGMHLTQAQLAERIGVTNSIIGRYETGERFPSYDVMVKIAYTFHVTTDYLLGKDRKCMLDLSDLSDDDITVVETMANALRTKNHQIQASA